MLPFFLSQACWSHNLPLFPSATMTGYYQKIIVEILETVWLWVLHFQNSEPKCWCKNIQYAHSNSKVAHCYYSIIQTCNLTVMTLQLPCITAIFHVTFLLHYLISKREHRIYGIHFCMTKKTWIAETFGYFLNCLFSNHFSSVLSHFKLGTVH